jgi:CRISPR system Cascade subunit CasA
VDLDFSRPDFNGAILEFLIGLIQLAVSPLREEDWIDLFTTPPEPSDLQAKLEPFAGAFDLDSEWHRLMQDPSVAATETKTIASLLIEAPGKQAVRENKAFFIKDGFTNTLCRACSAAALYTMQAYAPAGGKGFRTSLRGGGPLTTVLLSDPLSDSLWRTVMLNVLPSTATPESTPRVFLWMAAIPTSEKQEVIIPADVAAFHEYWGMPRRIQLHFEPMGSRRCDICGGIDETCVRTYSERNYGPNYQSGVWKHPLTPVYVANEMPRSPVHASSHCLQYRYWPSYVLSGSEDKSIPAPVVEHFLSRRERDLRDEDVDTSRIRMKAFGYDMDNMKARCWYDGSMPLFTVDAALHDQYRHRITGMIEAASIVANNCLSAVRRALFGHISSVTTSGRLHWDLPKGSGTDAALPQSVTDSFWEVTEPDFYTHIRDLRDVLDDEEREIALMHSWRTILAQRAESLFDSIVESADYTRTDPKHAVLARLEMEKHNRSKKIFVALDIPLETTETDGVLTQPMEE